MPKAPVSITLDVDNLLWLRGRATSRKRRSLSEAVDEIVTAARTGSLKVQPVRSVVGTIEFTDEDLEAADAYVQGLFATSLARPLVVRERPSQYRKPTNPSKTKSRGIRNRRA